MTRSLAELCAELRGSRGMQHKRDIATAYLGLGSPPDPCLVGDDCAALPDGDGYLLFAIEGLLDEFVRLEPWFAGYCAIMVNVSDIAAMGGSPTAVVDALWSDGSESAERIWSGMRDAARAYGVPIVGGHTNIRSTGARLAVAIVGRATKLLTSFDARPGDVLIQATDLRGSWFGPYPYWDASTRAPSERLRGDLELLQGIVRDDLASAAKDISMGGVLGTALMLLECSGVGAHIDLARIPKPVDAPLEKWLTSFPSFGFLLSAPAQNVAEIQGRFRARGIACEAIGSIDATSKLEIASGGERELFWDLRRDAFTGARSHVAV